MYFYMIKFLVITGPLFHKLQKKRYKIMYNTLQELRWERNWSQVQLARKSGVKQQTICAIENKRTANPKIRTVLSISNALGVPVEEVFTLYE